MRPRLPLVAASFATFGFFWGTWAVAAADVERSLHLSAGGLGLLLSGSVGVGGLVSAASGGLVARIGPGRALVGALALWTLGVAAAVAVPVGGAFLACFVLAMATAGPVDMAMNAAAAVALAGDTRGMVRFHALFNVGALAGAGCTGGLVHAGLSWRWSWAAAAGVALMLAVAGRRGAARPPEHSHPVVAAGRPSTSVLHSLRVVRRDRMVILACVFATTAMVEGGIDTWGVLYLRTQLAVGVLVGAGAYAVGQGIAFTTRMSAASAARRVGTRVGLLVGAAVAATGLALEAASSGVAPAALGLALAAGGISLCWPLVMARLATTGAEAPALISGFTATGYLGWVLGPAVVGWLADARGLPAGLALLAGLAAAAATAVWADPGRVEREVA